MTDEPDPPPSPQDPAEQPPGDEEAARLLEVGLSGPSAPTPKSVPSPADIAPQFPDLEILEVLGHGGMGVVYKARQRKLDRLVALKVLPRELSEDPAFAERFSREARTLARLQHPHIVGVHEFGDRDGLYYLVMEFVDGVTLRRLMADGEITPREALAIVPQICDALQDAHDQGVVHRDIKPENILLDRLGRVKVADFGLAKLVERAPGDFTLTGTDQVMGTIHYMAPEQYKTPQDVDHRADIFSLGVVFYEMLTGELPVGRVQKPSETKDLDARIDEIVMRALERERDARYQKAAEVESDVKTVVEHPSTGDAREENERGSVGLQLAIGASAGPRRDPDPRPLSRLVTWALWLIPIGIVAGFLTYGVVYHADDPYHGSKAGLIVGASVGGLVMLLAIAAILRTRKAGAPGKGFGLSVGTLVAALGGTVIALAALAEEISDYQRRRSFRGFSSPSRYVTVRGAPDYSSQLRIRDDVLRTWNAYRKRILVRDLTLDDLPDLSLYDSEDVTRLRAMPEEEFERKRRANELGMGLVGSETLEVAPHRFSIQSIEVDEWGRNATVSAYSPYAYDPRKHKRPRTIHFFMKRIERGWVFAVDKVNVEGR